MLDWLKKKSSERNADIRDTLFGDTPLAEWISVPPDAIRLEPWASFRRAKELIDSGDTGAATSALQGVLAMPELESRQHLQAYHFLRELGVPPPSLSAKQVLGVIVEVGMQTGLDLVAAYADHHARYYNYSGAGIVWERPNGALDPDIDDMLNSGQVVVNVIGPWEKVRPPAPSIGQLRINMLTPSGLHFGQGPHELLAKDPLAGPVIAAAFRLMQQLTVLPCA